MHSLSKASFARFTTRWLFVCFFLILVLVLSETSSYNYHRVDTDSDEISFMTNQVLGASSNHHLRVEDENEKIREETNRYMQRLSTLLKENIHNPVHQSSIEYYIRNWYRQSTSPLVLFATGRPGTGKTKTFDCIQQAFFGCSQQYQGQHKCYLKINGMDYRSEQNLTVIENELSQQIVDFINNRYKLCNLVIILTEYQQVIHYPMASLLLSLQSGSLKGLDPFVNLGNVMFLLAGNKAYEGSVPDETQMKMSELGEMVHIQISSDDKTLKNRPRTSEVDRRIESNRQYINEVNPFSPFDQKLNQLPEEQRNTYLQKARSLFASQNTVLLIFKLQSAQLLEVVKLKIREYIYKIHDLNRNIIVDMDIPEASRLLLDHLIQTSKCFYSRPGGAIQHYLQSWFDSIVMNSNVDGLLLSTHDILTNSHTTNLSEYKFSQIENLTCGLKEQAILAKMLNVYNNNQRFSRYIQSSGYSHIECKLKKIENGVEIVYLRPANTLAKLVNFVTRTRYFKFPESTIEQYKLRQKEIDSALAPRLCFPTEPTNLHASDFRQTSDLHTYTQVC
ncbi:hypothetical protein FDP41_005029 [Naegleria fowleri]|uniref:AAA+ ATPase domain-containing protein n=1 Tax=Naegleria fowleri TaxID=5763 RepID=A0A6A5BLH7_NAEFO|nr:uncharacterized protein FDP41_005029 [Naegleria fowleri]KAF0975702.1 hypothetical protein FDP41_005029 [Naegleria fowleri]